jgi:hypothetical protein
VEKGVRRLREGRPIRMRSRGRRVMNDRSLGDWVDEGEVVAGIGGARREGRVITCERREVECWRRKR